jgi:probable selenium-dependent hydroxylase accessory protein YqeC
MCPNSNETATPLVRALAADRGVTCVVGAGGKKSTLYALASRLTQAVVTSTVRIPPFEQYVASVRITEQPTSVCREADHWPLGIVPARDGSDRYRGYSPGVIDELAAALGDDCPILVKADGARSRLLKAPNENEPQLPMAVDTVVPIASVHVIGEKLDDRTVHRPERVAAITGLSMGDRIGPEHVAAVLTSERGGRKGVPSDAVVVPLLNMADDAGLASVARCVAEDVLERADVPRVVISRMTAGSPVVDIVS